VKTPPANPTRRKALIGATCAIGGAGAVAVATAFVQSLKPTGSTLKVSAQRERQVVNLDGLASGASMQIDVMHQPVLIVRRTDAQVQALTETDARLADPSSMQSQQPDFAKNRLRSIYPEFLIVQATCTHLGCAVKHVSPQEGALYAIQDDWQEGFDCPCHSAKFDLAGRVYKGMPAPTNLRVPNHRFLSATEVVFEHPQDNF
jgi:ubiquinol-cytochrome c reductase iron-sulfur subunit